MEDRLELTATVGVDQTLIVGDSASRSAQSAAAQRTTRAQPSLWRRLREECDESARHLVGQIPGSIGRRVRAAYYASVLKSLGREASIGMGMEIVAPENIAIGDRFIALRNCFLCADLGGQIRMGDDVSLATNVMVNAGCQGLIAIGNGSGLGNNCVARSSAHLYQDPRRPFKTQGHKPGTIIIEEDVWVAANTTLLPGTHLERGCVVSAGSVVGGLVKAYTVVAGNPARVVGMRG